MKIFILITQILFIFCLEGCAFTRVINPFSQKNITKEILLQKLEKFAQESQEPKDLTKKYLIQNSNPKKIAFLMAFNKLGFDLTEVAKLMDEEDEKELSVKKFVTKNAKHLLVEGTLQEIFAHKPIFSSTNSNIIDELIYHLELNYKFYLKVNFNIYE